MKVYLIAVAAALCQAATDWPSYGNDPGGTRYSALDQITRSNVSRLKVAWTYRTGALKPDTPLNQKAAFEATPILVNGTLYLSTPFDQIIALDPGTGHELWTYDPAIDRNRDYSEVTSRGVSAWRSPNGSWRIYAGTLDARLIALDAKTGKPCADFGNHGQIDLTKDVILRDPGNYQVTSPPAVAGNLVIVGSSIGDNRAVTLERGIVRAFDAQTGALKWTWDPIPWSEKASPRTGAANAWSVLSVDAARDFVFIPTGSASPDFYGGLRPGDDKWADSVVALRASTGEFIWGFQVVHHDLWDYDVPSQPVLFTFRGRPAVAITTKMGNVFVLDRLTGKPLSQVNERKVPQDHVQGEEPSPTQPFSALPALVPQRLSAEEAWGIDAEDQAACRDRMAKLRNAGLPASAQATPMTYSVGGKQFVVICAGGHGKLGTKQGDAVVAFALEPAR